MKALPCLFLLITAGCAHTTVILDPTARPPTHNVEVYKDGAMPAGRYQTIAEISWHGPRQDELIAQKYFMKEAGKLGADAIIFEIADNQTHYSSSNISAGGISAGESKQSTDWFFKCKAISYRPAAQEATQPATNAPQNRATD